MAIADKRSKLQTTYLTIAAGNISYKWDEKVIELLLKQ